MRTAFLFDIDGTIVKTDVLPCIASVIGLGNEITALIKARREGHIECEHFLRLGCSILGHIPLETVRGIVSNIPLNEVIRSFIHERSADCFLVTENLDIWMQPLVENCGCRMYSSQCFWESGDLKLGNILNQGEVVKEIRSYAYDRIIAVGTTFSNAPLLADSDVAIAFGGSQNPSRAAVLVSDYIIHDETSLCRMLHKL